MPKKKVHTDVGMGDVNEPVYFKVDAPIKEELKAIARSKYMPLSILLRQWVMEELMEYRDENRDQGKG
jgi:hypothetical protein